MVGFLLHRKVFLLVLVFGWTAGNAHAQFNVRPEKKTSEPAKERELDRIRDEADAVLAPLTGDGAYAPTAEAAAAWSIVLVAFTGETQTEAATLGHAKVVNEAGLTATRIEKRDKATVIAYGRYDGPDDPRATEDLERLRTMRVGGQMPFAAALLSPPDPSHLTGSLPDLDLRNAKRLFGKDKALYTLQVAIYGRGDRSPASAEEIAEFRATAERAAALLRRDGELAFYYHAPERSMVTIGVFGQQDYDPRNRAGIESIDLIMARERHPLNLLNGNGIYEKIPGSKDDGPRSRRLQPSQLVSIPGG